MLMNQRSMQSLPLVLLALFTAISAHAQAARPAPSVNQVRKPIPSSILAKPDLKLEEAWLAIAGPSTGNSSEIRLSGSAPLGATIRLLCRLTNAGADVKIPFTVTYLIDGTIVGTDMVYGLASAQTAISALSYQNQAAGTHKFRCEVDRENKVVETNESDNSLEILFTVAGSTPSTAPGSLSAPRGTPGIVEDKQLRQPRTPPGSGGSAQTVPSSEPTFPSNEPTLASASFGDVPIYPVEVPAALSYQYVVVPMGSTLTLLRAADLSAVRSVSCDGDLRDQPSTVVLGSGKTATFVASAAGTIYAIDQPSMAIAWQRNLRRAGCTADGVTARPLIHQRRDASARFKAAHPMDLVYVATNYMATSGCTTSHNTANRIYGLDAFSGLPVWTFNESGTESLDGITRAGSLDMANDRLFLGSKRSYSATQHTVWAIDVVTGTRVWSTNAGAIETTPVLLDDRILAASRPGAVSASSRSTGDVIWSLQIGQPPSPSISAMMAATFLNIGRAVCVVMSGGRIRLLKDNSNSGEIVWDVALPGGRKAVSRPTYEPNSDMLYVGADDGQVYQINATTGEVTANRVINPGGTGIVGDPFLWQSGGVVKLIAGSSAGRITEYLVPWPTETFGP
jgi:outer membrane protein assembly factor BamB